MPHARPQLACAIALLALGSSLVACGSTQAKPSPPPTITTGLADADDPVGTAQAFDYRLGNTARDAEHYPLLLERTALAHLELADAYAADAEALLVGAPPSPLAGSLGAAELAQRAQAQRAEAVRLGEDLVASFPSYEGGPAMLLILGYEYEVLGEDDKRSAVLERLRSDFGSTDYGLDATLLLGKDAFDAKRMDDARALFTAVVTADPDSERGAFAAYLLAWVELGWAESRPTAFERIVAVVLGSGTDATLREQARREVPLFYAQLERGPEAAADALRPIATEALPLDALLELVAGYYAQLGRDDWAQSLRAPAPTVTP